MLSRARKEGTHWEGVRFGTDMSSYSPGRALRAIVGSKSTKEGAASSSKEEGDPPSISGLPPDIVQYAMAFVAISAHVSLA